jgi:hypothetical protein
MKSKQIDLSTETKEPLVTYIMKEKYLSQFKYIVTYIQFHRSKTSLCMANKLDTNLSLHCTHLWVWRQSRLNNTYCSMCKLNTDG